MINDKNKQKVLIFVGVLSSLLIIAVFADKFIFKTGVLSSTTYNYGCRNGQNGCIGDEEDNPVEINIVDNQKTTSNLRVRSVVDITTTFKINDNRNTYYYLWRTYNNGKLIYTSPCQKVTTAKKYTTLTMGGKIRQGEFLIYRDNKCKQYTGITKKTRTFTTSEFLVQYNANGGSGSMANTIITRGVKQRLRKNTFKRSNYYFLGWRVYNKTRDKWVCYINAKHSDQDYRDQKDCLKYGYVIYNDNQYIANTAQPGEIVEFRAHWQYNYKQGLVGFSGFEKNPTSGNVKATVWPMIKLTMFKNSNGTYSTGKTVPQGTALKVLDMTNMTNQKNSYVKVNYKGTTGWINGEYVMINLPDVIPSAIYNISNASSSLFKSKNKTINKVTGKNLYGSNYSWYQYNPRLGYKQYIVPLRLPTAKKFQVAQTNALRYGNKIKVYDAFRPWTIQKLVKDNLKDSNFSGKYYCVTNQFPNNKNSNGSTRCLYEYKGWFIALRLSSHNVAKAVDVSMVTKDDNQEISTQTPMHELSGWAIPTNTEVNKYPSEIAMNSLFTNSGFHYLISEWWHFEDKGRYAVSGTEYLGADTKANHLELAK